MRYSAHNIFEEVCGFIGAYARAKEFQTAARAVIYASQLFNSGIIERVAAEQCTRRAALASFFCFFICTVDRQLRDCDQRSEPITRPFVLISIIHTRFASSMPLARFTG